MPPPKKNTSNSRLQPAVAEKVKMMSSVLNERAVGYPLHMHLYNRDPQIFALSPSWAEVGSSISFSEIIWSNHQHYLLFPLD